MKIGKYYLFALVYFFINAVGLPLGLLYTTILTPLFYIWLVLQRKGLIILNFFLLLLPFVVIHLLNGVNSFAYIKSVFLLLSVYIFGYSFYMLAKKRGVLSDIFNKILKINFFFTIVSLVLLATSLRTYLWSELVFVVPGLGVAVSAVPRLKMLTYEPSYYATLLIPFVAYSFLTFLLKLNAKSRFSGLAIAGIPLFLSLSLGVISSLIISIILLILLKLRRFLKSRKMLISFITFLILAITGLILLQLSYPDNPITARAIAFLNDEDTSGKGRTFEAFQLAYEIASVKSIWWGVGPGQLKIIGDPIIKSFYSYGFDYGTVRIPNAVAETLALFGVIGVIIRLVVQVYFFFKAKVLDNYFQTLLFIFIFVYQFTGSFTTNIAEYVIWILAFTTVFPQFDKRMGIINANLDEDRN